MPAPRPQIVFGGGNTHWAERLIVPCRAPLIHPYPAQLYQATVLGADARWVDLWGGGGAGGLDGGLGGLGAAGRGRLRAVRCLQPLGCLERRPYATRAMQPTHVPTVTPTLSPPPPHTHTHAHGRSTVSLEKRKYVVVASRSGKDAGRANQGRSILNEDKMIEALNASLQARGRRRVGDGGQPSRAAGGVRGCSLA